MYNLKIVRAFDKVVISSHKTYLNNKGFKQEDVTLKF